MVITGDCCEFFNIWNQIYSKTSFAEEIRNQGFEMLDIFDNICGKPFTGLEESMCGVFTKK